MQAREVDRSRTFTEERRRIQIVEAAIATIAEIGYTQASFAKIAKRAGLSSTGLISYHFDGKDDLVTQIVTRVFDDMAEHMSTVMSRAKSPVDALRLYIEGAVAYIGDHRIEMKAMQDVFMNGGIRYDTSSEQEAVSPLTQILVAGQTSGVFRHFDPTIMATVIQRSVDGLPFLLANHPDLDVATYADELVTMFALATKAS